MTFKENLIKARSHIIFLLGLLAAFAAVIALERWDIEGLSRVPDLPASQQEGPIRVLEALQEKWIAKEMGIPAAPPRSLSEREMGWARIAWKYFESNVQPTTGMVNSVDGYPSSTMWDTASYLMALIAVERLAIISLEDFDARLSAILRTLAGIPLFEESLPNKSYDTVSGNMTDYNNQPTQGGIGWSAIDIGRLLVPFNIVVWNYPEHTREVQAVLRRWRLERMVRDGLLFGAAINEKQETVLLQEGRIGYEEYAAKSLGLMGWDVSGALKVEDFLEWVDVYGLQVPYDRRDPEIYHAHNYVVSEPYMLDGMEFGWDEVSRVLAYLVYAAQEERYRHTNILTAVSEDHIDQPPYFVYNTVFTNGKIWNCITEKGEDASRFKSISTKAVLGWYALYQTPYTEQLLEHVSSLFDPEKGWYSGEYEASGQPNKAITCNTNAIILESLCYKRFGSMLRIK